MNIEELRLNLKNAGKYQLRYLQTSSSNWMAFLSKSCNHYSRSFLEQLLITARFPNATAVMEESLWQKNNFSVKEGETGIVVFQNFDGDFYDNQKLNGATTKVYYDISQVEKIAGKDIYRWSIGDIDEKIVINSLEANYTNVNTSTFAHSVITAISAEVTIKDINLKNFIVNSAAYQVLTRCGYNANSIFKSEDFKIVTKFSSENEFIQIATKSNELSSDMLKHIAKVVRKHYNESKVSVKEETRNEHNIQSTRRYEQGRTNNNLHTVSQERNKWSVNSDSGSDGRRTDGAGSVRSEALEVSSGGTSGQIYGADVVGEHNGVSSQHRSDGTEEERNNNRTTEESTGSNRRAERERPDEMGRLDEQHNSISRGDSSSRDSLRLSSNSQVNITDNEAEVDVQNQTSAFSISQEVIDNTFCRGNFDNVFQTKLETYQQFEKNLSIKDNAEFLKKQFGTGGGSHAGGHASYQYMHNAKGFTISSHFDNNNSRVLFTWEQVATRLYQLIRMDRYLNPKEKEYYPKWLEEQAMKEAERSHQEKANEIHPTEEQEYIYQYAVGDKVYLGSSEYEISLISNDGLVSLQDAHFPLVDKEMKREDFESLLKESIFNDHLRKPKSTHNRDLFIAYASNKLIENQAVINAYKNSDIENFKLEVNVAVDKLAIDLLVNQEAIDNLTVDEVREVITEFQNIITVKETIYDTVSTNIDIALMQHNEGSQVDDIDFSDPFDRVTEDTETVQNELVNSDGYTNYYRIYQLKDTPDYHGIRFQNSARNQKQGVKLNKDDYDFIYEGNGDELKDISEWYRLEYIWTKFNTDLPENFRGHLLSVSDVIVLGNEDTQKAYYVDSVGFMDFPEFFREKELEHKVTLAEYLSENNNLGQTILKLFSSDEVPDVAYSLGIRNSPLFEKNPYRDTKENVAKREISSRQYSVFIDEFNSNLKFTSNDTELVLYLSDDEYSCSWKDVGESLYSVILEYTLDDMYREIIYNAQEDKALISIARNKPQNSEDVPNVEYIEFDKEGNYYQFIRNILTGITERNDVILDTFDNPNELVDFLKKYKYVLNDFGINPQVLLDVEPLNQQEQAISLSEDSIEINPNIIPGTSHLDLFYVDQERENIEWVYYNPDSSAGGQYVFLDISFSQFREAYENTNNHSELFDYILSTFAIKQSLVDVDTDLFAEYKEHFSKTTPDFVNATDETMQAIFNTVNNQPQEVVNLENEPLQSNIPTITCEWSEHTAFENGKTYSVSEFDEIMEKADIEWIVNRQKEIEKYGSVSNALEANDTHYQGYAKTKFTINMPDGTKYTERQDIGDGDGGVISYLSQYPQYNNIVSILQGQILIERNTPIQDVSDTSEVQEEPISNTQSVEQDNADLIGKELTLGNRRFRVEKISMFGDVSLRDLEFERVNGFPISRVEKVELVRYALEMEAEMKKTSTATKSVDELQIGDIIRLEGEEWRIDEIIGDFYFRIINQDENARCSRKAFIENWKERLIRLGYEYIPPVKESTRNIPTADKINYIINDDNLGVGTKPERFQNNINAIRLLKAIESENRLATQEEQEILSKYVGWGGLDKYFNPTHSRYNELRECLTDDEFASASASTLTAFYTPPVVIKAMYKALDNLGFTNGNILEPSCGTGNFMGLLPESMQSSKMYGVELDSISGRIAKQLYQKNRISIGGYEKEQLPDSFFDVAVGNVPFGDFKLSDKRYNKHKFLIHDYFYAKTLDKVRPGGVVAFITSKGTLDKKDNKVRKYIAERATLLGAIRLPNDTFKGAAGTEVTSDILFLQKKEALSLENPDWLYLKENEDGIVINQYFVDNPDMVLGDIKLISGPYGLEMACVSNDDGTLEEKLNAAVAKIQGQIVTYNKAQDADDVIESTEVTAIPADPTVKNYSYAIVDGDLYFRKNSIMEKQSITGLPEERVRGLIKLRDIVRDLIDYQSNDYPDSDISAKRDELNNEYEKFTKKYGLINSRGNKLAFNQDSSFPLLTSLELLDEDGKLKRKSDIFYKRTIKPYIPVTYAETSIEALAVSLNERGKVDIEYMAKLTGFEQEKVIADLTDIIYPVPGKDEYQTADEYLSGDVRTKLFIAKSVAENDSKYKGNVVALENVQPKDLSAAEVKIRLGATWVDTKYIKQFIDEVFQPGYHTYKINVTYSEYTSKWNITSKSSDTGFLARNTYGTKDYNAYQLLELALNLKTPKVHDIKIIDGQEVKVFNPQKTTVARKKQEKIQEKFEEWIFADPQRRNDLLRKYNDTYNSIRNRTYNGSHLTFPGMNPEITLRPHQVNAIARTLYGGNTLLAHVVGAGKTFEMIASAMEAKRLGLCNKSLFVVPNHLTEQMGSDFLNLYPSANILVATKNDFSTHKRKEFCSRIATGEYDAVIIGHSQFEKIPVSLERQEAFMQEEINDIVNAIAEAKAQNGENFTIKQLEGEKKKLENKMKELYEDKAKDDVVTFEQLGVDRIFVDEAHKFKNLYIRTKMTNVAGITSSSADKSADLLMKCRYIDEITGGKGIVFATGTPVSNSMSELYTMQRYLQFDTLKKLGFAHFDSWASSFGATVTASELAPEGKKYREKTRFAKFFNLPELMNIFRECADIQTADMLNLPVPKAEFKTVVAKPSADQRNFVDECGNRADRVRSGSVDPREDNMLKITTDGRKLAVDQRIVNPELPDFENSKINMCVNNVFEIWQDTAEQRSTQLLFCDLSTPTTDGFNVYDDIRNKLISKGIPPKEIAFIHNYNTDAKKAALFSDVRQGKIRVLLGSTEKMGAGTNIQDKLVALHDLDCPWRPSDLEQRLGRILRQGNENEEIYVFRYVTEDTFDAYSYQLIENKQKFISQIMSSKTPVREAEDVDQSALSYAEIKMLATGNPLIKEKMDLDIKQTNLKVLKADYLSNKYKLEDMILNTPKEVAIKERFINELSLDMATVDEHPINNDEFKMVLNGTTYTDKKTAGMYLIKLLDTLPHHVKTDEFTVGEYRGFTLSVARRDNQPYAYLKGYLSYSVEMSDDIYGNITRLNNKLSAISERKDKAVLSLEDYNRQMEKVKKEVEKPFEHEAELKNVNDRLEEVNRMLNAKGNSEYRTITKAELELLKDTDVELDFVPDRSGNGDFIIRFEKVESDKVENALKPSTSNSLKI